MALIPQTAKATNSPVTAPKLSVSALDAVLTESGFVEPVKRDDTTLTARDILNKKGATLDAVLDNMVGLMSFAENESVRLKAIENGLSIHGVDIKNTERSGNNNVQIVFNNVENGPQRLDAIFCPER